MPISSSIKPVIMHSQSEQQKIRQIYLTLQLPNSPIELSSFENLDSSLNKFLIAYIGEDEFKNSCYVKQISLGETANNKLSKTWLINFPDNASINLKVSAAITAFEKELKLQIGNDITLSSTPYPIEEFTTEKSFFQTITQNNLFWNISGASSALLRKSPTDHNKYKSLGAAILFTGCFAFISSNFALSYVTDNWWIKVPVSLLWCMTIINIDMLIVNTMVKYSNFNWTNIFGVLARILLAVAIAFALSIPVEMKLLEDEIKDEIDRYDKAYVDSEIDSVLSSYAYIEDLKASKFERETQFNNEMQGDISASGRIGYGVIAKKIESQVSALDKDIELAEMQRDSTVAQLKTQLNKQIEDNNKYGFLASFRALHRLQYQSEDNAVLWISWGIRILLLLIELLPIISKLLMRRGAYDALYELEESKAVQLSDRLRS